MDQAVVERAWKFLKIADPDPTSALALGTWFAIIASIRIALNALLIVESLCTKSSFLLLIFALLPTIIEIGLRWSNHFVSVRAARIVVAPFPLIYLVDPFLTIKSSRTFRVTLQSAIMTLDFATRLHLRLFCFRKEGQSDFSPNDKSEKL